MTIDKTKFVLQVTEKFSSWDAAFEALSAQRQQVGYLDGRLRYRDGVWGIQAFHDAGGIGRGVELPDGMRVVIAVGWV